MSQLLRLSNDPLAAWARDAIHAGDFTRNIARFNRRFVGPHQNIPGWSFARAATHYSQDVGGNWRTFGSGVPAITDRGLSVASNQTNQCLWSRDLTNAAWVKSNVTAAKDQTGFLGDATAASSLTATSSDGTALQSFVLGSNKHTFCPMVKRITGTGEIDITVDNGSTWNNVTSLLNTSSFTQVSCGQAALTNPVVGFRIRTSGDAIAVDGCTLLTGPNVPSTTPALTTSASASRGAADVITFPWANSAALTIFTESERLAGCITIAGSDFGAALSVNDGSSANETYLTLPSRTTGSGFATVSSTVKNTLNKGSGLTAGQIVRLATAVQTNAGLGSCNGAAANGADIASVAIPTTPTVSIGVRGNSWYDAGYIRRWAIFARALTAGELNALTA